MRALKILLILLTLLSSAAGASAQWPNGYTYSGTITINASQVANADQTNFPVLVSGIYADLATTSNGGRVTSGNGYDIIFTSDSQGLNKLNFERESYSPTTGQVAFWVQMPSLSHTTNTAFYVFYGNSSVTTDQSNKTAVWDASYVGVWHMADNAASTTVSDSTANGNNGTAAAITSARAATGAVNGALSFNGTTDGVLTNVSTGKTFTWEAWINSASITSTNYQSVITIPGTSYMLMDVRSGSASIWAPGTDSLVGATLGITGLSNNTWYHVVFVRAGDSSPSGYSAYLNGVMTGQRSSGTWSSAAASLAFGTRADMSGQVFSGTLDEIRISNTARSANWIATEFKNESSPSTFYSAVWGQTNGGGTTVAVPNVVGQTLSTASTAITGAGLVVGSVTQQSSSTVAVGTVISENPIAATLVSPGSSVNLVVSSGPANVSVPNVVGQSLSAASTAITGAGLLVGTTTQQSSNAVTAGNVISQSPTASTLVLPGSSVNLVVSTGPAGGSSYGYFGIITVNASQVSTSDQANFPVLVSGTYADLATTGNGGKVSSANGYDIIFTSDAQGLNKLNFERESYSPITGQVVFWVQIPNLSHTTNTTFYVFYGNSSVTTDQSSKAAVWDANYVGVWHMADNAASTTVSDSTSNGRNGSAAAITSARATTGEVDGALSFNGTSDGVTTSASVGKTFTWEAWINSASFSSSSYQSVITIPGTSYMLMDLGGAGASIWAADAISGSTMGITGLASSTWYHIALVRSGDGSSTGYSAYLNGSLKGQKASGTWSSAANLAFGTRTDASGQAFAGTLDEIRVSNIARAPSWIATEYNNESNPPSFYTAVLGQVNGGGGTTVPVPNVLGQTQSAASTAVTGVGLVVGTITQQSSNTVTGGNVISSNPAAGSLVSPGSSVNLVISTGPATVSVPNVLGQTQSAASTAITGVGLVVGTITQQSSNTVTGGNVISSNPAAGSLVSPGSSVNLVISTGPPTVSVPNVLGQTQSAASTAITGAGLVVGTITQQSSSTVTAGNVISSNPAAGALVSPGSSVNLVVSTGSSGGSGSGYGFFGAITVSATQVSTSDQANFPVLVSGAYSDLAAVSNGGKVTNSNGYDIIFTADANGLIPLNFEREYYSPTGQVVFWVQVPLLSHTADTTFYVFYGNPGITTDQSNRAAVWDSNYVGVWHMADNAASTLVSDSTTNGRNGSSISNTNIKSTAGVLDGALNFNGVNDSVTASAPIGKTFTWEAWINSGSIAGKAYQSILAMAGSYMLMDVQGGAGSFWSLDSLNGSSLGVAGLANGSWYHLVFARSGDGSPTGYSAYLNGVLKGQASSGTWSSAAPLAFGARLDNSTQNFSGMLDEIRVSNVVRSAGWIATEYKNESNPAAFYSVVLGQAVGGGTTGGTPALAVNPTDFSFSGISGSSNPAAQSVNVSSSNSTPLGSWTAIVSPGSPWLTLSTTSSGAGSSAISGPNGQIIWIHAATSGLGAGMYSGTVMITSSTASPSTQTINVSATVTAPGPAGYWTLDSAWTAGNTIYDASPNHLNGAMISGVSSTTGVVNQGLTFDGATGYVLFPQDSATDLTGNMSVALWIKTQNTSQTEALVARYSANGAEWGYLLRINPAGHLECRIGGNNNNTGIPVVLTDTGKLINDNQWHHVAAVITIGQGVSFYIDGLPTSTLPLNILPQPGAAPLQFALNPWSQWGTYFAGSMDDVRIYNRLLQPSEVTTLATPSLIVSPPPPPPALSVTPSSLSFTGRSGINSVTSQPINISNLSFGPLNWSASSSDTWLTMATTSNGSGSPTTSGTGPQTLWIQVASATLAPGPHSGSIAVNAPGASPSQQTVTVSVNLVSADTPGLVVTPGNILFTILQGSSNAIAQTMNISNSGGGSLGSWSTTSNQSWLALSSASGAGTQSLTIALTPAVAALSPGEYSAALTFSSSGAVPASETVNVALVVVSPSSPPGGGQSLYNGIILPTQWPPVAGPSQAFQVPPYIASPPQIIHIDVGRQLFVDDFLIQNTTLARTEYQPVMYPANPVLHPNSSDTQGLAMPYSDGLWFDPASQNYKMWFYCGPGNSVCYATSADGITWNRPVIPGAPSSNPSQVLTIGSGRDSDVIWMDLQDTDPSRKFKAFAYYPSPSANMLTWFSPDGITWTAAPQTPLIDSIVDRTTLFWNPFRSVWVDSIRNQLIVPATPYRPSISSDRVRYYSESPSVAPGLSHWTPSNFRDSYWTSADEQDPPYAPGGAYPQLYNLDSVAYESLMVGLFSWYYPDQALVELGVGFSRDGFNWVRPNRGAGPLSAFIPASNIVGKWDESNTQSVGGGFLVVGDQLRFYFSGRDSPHGTAALGGTGLATLRRDGFYSMDAGSGGGVLTTRPVQFTGQYLFVNVKDTQGTLQVQVLQNGQVVATSQTITADSTLQPVSWIGLSDLSTFAGQPVQFRFNLTNGSLYSFWVSQTTNGASCGYVAAGGPGFTTNVDTAGSCH